MWEVKGPKKERLTAKNNKKAPPLERHALWLSKVRHKLQTCENPNYRQIYTKVWKKGVLGLRNAEESEYSLAFSHLVNTKDPSPHLSKYLKFVTSDGTISRDPLGFTAKQLLESKKLPGRRKRRIAGKLFTANTKVFFCGIDHKKAKK